MTAGALPTLHLDGPWERLHRAESVVLASLLTKEEEDAVRRRLGLPARGRVSWIPVSSGAEGGRFAPPQGPGALYLGNDLDTCVAEVEFHHARICAASKGTPSGARAILRRLFFQATGDMADATAQRAAGLHSPSDYGPSWAYAGRVRAAGLDGVHFRSVRRRGGRCLAIYQERAARFLCVEFGAVVLEWDGKASRRIA